MSGITVAIETGTRRVFASALDWPGWCRSGKDETAALDALASYADRYGPVAKRARIAFPARRELHIVERARGNATTDFGAPSIVATAERRATPAQARRATKLIAAAWDELADVAARSPATLRKGPRGGGRDRDKMLAHVRDAEGAYASGLGLRKATRDDILAAIERPIDGARWPALYAARRIAWHALDHAWEMEDKAS